MAVVLERYTLERGTHNNRGLALRGAGLFTKHPLGRRGGAERQILWQKAGIFLKIKFD